MRHAVEGVTPAQQRGGLADRLPLVCFGSAEPGQETTAAATVHVGTYTRSTAHTHTHTRIMDLPAHRFAQHRVDDRVQIHSYPESSRCCADIQFKARGSINMLLRLPQHAQYSCLPTHPCTYSIYAPSRSRGRSGLQLR